MEENLENTNDNISNKANNNLGLIEVKIENLIYLVK